MIATTPLGATPGMVSASNLSPAAEDDGSSMPGFPKEQKVFEPPSVNCAINRNTVATLDPLQRLPPTSSVTDSDVTGVGRPLWEPNAAHTVDRPPDPSCNQYDMV